MPTFKHVQIHLSEPSRSNAALAVYPKPKREAYEQLEDYQDRVKVNNKLRRQFTGPHFHAVYECEIEEGVVHVLVGNAGYVYPLHTVARLKVYTEEVPEQPTPPASTPSEFAAFDADIPF